MEIISYHQKRAREASELLLWVCQGGHKSYCQLPMISNMAAPICIKLSGFIKYMVESVLAKEFFEELKKEKTLISKIARGHWVQSIQPG